MQLHGGSAAAYGYDAPEMIVNNGHHGEYVPEVKQDVHYIDSQGVPESNDHGYYSSNVVEVNAYGYGSNHAPAEYANAPAVYANAPAVYANAPAVYTNAPAVYTNAPAVYTNAPAVYADAPAMYKDTYAGYSNKGAANDHGSYVPEVKYDVHQVDSQGVPESNDHGYYSSNVVEVNAHGYGSNSAPAVYANAPAVYTNAPVVYANAPAMYNDAYAGYSNKGAANGHGIYVPEVKYDVHHVDSQGVPESNDHGYYSSNVVEVDAHGYGSNYAPVVYAGAPAVYSNAPVVYANAPADYAKAFTVYSSMDVASGHGKYVPEGKYDVHYVDSQGVPESKDHGYYSSNVVPHGYGYNKLLTPYSSAHGYM